MTISSLERQRPHFPPDLRCRIAEMVNENFCAREDDLTSPLADFLPVIQFVDEGLALYFSALGALDKRAELTTPIADSLVYLRTLRQLQSPDSDPALKVLIQALNVKRTGFADQFYRKGILTEEYSNAVKTLYMDLPEVIQCSRHFAAGVIHPVLDKDPELLLETYMNLETVQQAMFHRQFEQHCQQLKRRPPESSLLPPEDINIIPTSSGDFNWPNANFYQDPMRDIQGFIPEVILEGVEQVKDQFLALRLVHVSDPMIQRLQDASYPGLMAAWTRVAEQVRLLLYLMNIHLDIQEAVFQVQWEYLFLQLRSDDDPALEMVIMSKLKHILKETPDHVE